jgi:hypothetical protein
MSPAVAASCREFAISQINSLPEEAVRKVVDFMASQNFCRFPNPGDYDSDTDYLYAVPGMVDRILRARNAPAENWKDVPEELFDV